MIKLMIVDDHAMFREGLRRQFEHCQDIHAGGRKPSRLDSLSKREFEVLTHLSQGLHSNEIAAKLDLSEKTVSTYKARLMQKLNLANLSDLIRFAIDNGVSD